MSAYTEQVLVDKLVRMSNSQQSIQTLSHWIIYHRKRYQQSVQIWEKELYKASKDRKLVFLFLANDILQTSRKKGGEFIKEFARVIKSAVIHVNREGGVEAQKGVNRILEVWDTRRVFPKEFVDEIRRALHGEVASSHSAFSNHDNSSPKVSPSIPAPLLSPQIKSNHPIAEALRKIEEAEVTSEIISERVAALKPGVLNGDAFKHFSNNQELSSLANDLEDAIFALHQYRKNMEEDVERRNKLIALLSDGLEKQEQTINKLGEKMKECNLQLAVAEQTKSILKPVFDQHKIPLKNSASPTSQMNPVEKSPSTPPYSPSDALESPPRDTQPIPKRQKREFSSVPPRNANVPPFPPTAEFQQFLANIALQNPQFLGALNPANWQQNPNWGEQQPPSSSNNYNPV